MGCNTWCEQTGPTSAAVNIADAGVGDREPTAARRQQLPRRVVQRVAQAANVQEAITMTSAMGDMSFGVVPTQRGYAARVKEEDRIEAALPSKRNSHSLWAKSCLCYPGARDSSTSSAAFQPR